MSGEQKSSSGLGATLRTWVLPSFDETALFLMAVTCLWLLALSPPLRLGIENAVRDNELTGWLYVILGWASVGLAFALYHAFVRRPKSFISKTSMAVFALVTNVVAGLLMGLGRFTGEIPGSRTLAMINIGSAVLLTYQIALNDQAVISDGDATFADLALGLAVLAPLFYYFSVYKHTPWPLTFSLCVSYSTLIHHNAARIFTGIRSRMSA